MEKCLFCNFEDDEKGRIILENDSFICIEQKDDALVGWCIIAPKRHVETPFEFSNEELVSQNELLVKTKRYLDKKYNPDGYNFGCNFGKVAGQSIPHAHMHIFARYSNEPNAGKGLRWLKRTE